MDETTTTATTQDTGVDNTTQPEEQQTAAVTTEQDTNNTEQGESTTESDTSSTTITETDEDDLSDYWSKKGIDISTPEGQLKAAKSYREAEKAMHSKSQKASELAKQLDKPVQVDTDNPLLESLAQRFVAMERTQNIEKFVGQVNLTTEQENKMATYLIDNPEKADLVNQGYLSLQDLYTISGAKEPVDTSKIKKQGAQEALETLRNKQATTVPRGNASQATTNSGDSLTELEARLSDVKF
jgi:hypothetical protein